MPSRIEYFRGWEPGGEGLSLSTPSLFISEVWERVEEQLPACREASAGAEKQGQEARWTLSPTRRQAGKGHRLSQGRKTENVCFRQEMGP